MSDGRHMDQAARAELDAERHLREVHAWFGAAANEGQKLEYQLAMLLVMADTHAKGDVTRDDIDALMSETDKPRWVDCISC